MNKKRTLMFILGIFFLLLLTVFIIRAVSPRQLDDVTPGIPCERNLIEKSQILYVIPKFKNQSIAENSTWCKELLSMNKTLALHGVYHTYLEFNTTRNQGYLDEGIRIFEDCFNQTPKSFKPPHIAINEENIKLIKKNMKLDYKINQITHKVYHCSDTGFFSNRFMDWF